ncbi:MAG: tRNA (5-methylaminomethyl-2-thiouridine)(34)-methyltransferase MnmD [Ilyomonas sp.]
MLRKIEITRDGSATIAIPEQHVTYHSIHGAIQESKHVFIEAGLKPMLNKFETIHLFEMGFGTGLNALLTLVEALEYKQQIVYHTVELFPLSMDEILQLNYSEQLHTQDLKKYFLQIHACEWEKGVELHPLFVLHKLNISLTDIIFSKKFHLIYFDAFAPSAQPELWTESIFEKLYAALETNGILVTYCSKGDVRRAMLSADFEVEKLKGPPGKREMIRGIKP